MWSKTTRGQYDRKGQRYPSDLTDEEWALVEPYLRPMRRVDRRDVLNAILYVLTTGCQWRQLPKDFPPKSTVHGYFIEWHCDGTLTRLHHALYCAVRELEGRVATPTTSIVDSQSVKGAEKRGAPIDASGYDAGKKIKGKKRHIAVDTLGLMRPMPAETPGLDPIGRRGSPNRAASGDPEHGLDGLCDSGTCRAVPAQARARGESTDPW